MKMPAVRLEESRSPYQGTVAGRGVHQATTPCPIDPADKDFAKILARAGFLQDSDVAPSLAASGARRAAPFPRFAVKGDAGAGTEPANPVWSGQTRLSLMIGLPLALWAGIFALAHFVG